MKIGVTTTDMDQPTIGTGDTTIIAIAVTAVHSIFVEFGADGFSRFLDTIAETDVFQDMTGVD